MPARLWYFFLLIVLLLSKPCLHAQQTPPAASIALAPTPPMGWNSWDSFGLTITESQFRENVDVLHRRLQPFGWNLAVIDEGWFLRNPKVRPDSEQFTYELDADGRYIPVPARFPSALTGGGNTGFAALGAFVHAQGLRFGIHVVRGIPRESTTRNLPVANSPFRAQEVADTTDACPWNKDNWGVRDTPAGQAWYDALLQQYAAWGVDFLKVDCISDHPYRSAEIRMLHRAIAHSGRPIILSLSPGPTSAGFATELSQMAQLWRISDDVWDVWSTPDPFPRSIRDQFELAAGWVPFSRPGNWPDADMLPLGYLGPEPGFGKARSTNLTHAEQQTMLTLWSIARSPLILGANLTHLDDWTTALLTNREVLAVNQQGHDQRQVSRELNSLAWTSAGAGDIQYLALFNLGDTSLTVDHPFTFYSLPRSAYASTELWSGSKQASSTSVHTTLAPHSSILLKLQ